MHTSMLRPTRAAGLILSFSFLPNNVVAEPAGAAAAWQDEPIVVTASRTEQRAGNAPARVSVITRADIERAQAPDLLELLRLEAGLDVVRNGGPGGQTSVFMRGANSNHVLVLIDGVRVAAAGTGAFTWEILDPALIERIEIVRGPRAARWGSDAIGGVIQIFTRRPQGLSAGVGYGSDNDRRASLAFGDQTGAVPLDLSLLARNVGGFSAQNPGGFSFNSDNDGFENYSAATGGSLALPTGEFSWRGRGAFGETEFDQGLSDFENWSWRFDYRHEDIGPWRWRAGLATVRDRLETESPFGRSEVVTRRLQGDWLVERDLGATGSWLFGVDAWRESGLSVGQWNRSRENLGVFSGLEGRVDALGYEASLRLDDDDRFGTEVTGNAGLNWRPDAAWRVFVNGGRGFRAPTFNQLFSPGFGGLFAGNPALDPERSWSGELGADYAVSPANRFTLSLFGNWIDDLIDFTGPQFQAVNVNKARIVGLEFTHDLSVGPWTSAFNLTWQDPEDRAADRDLLRRPAFKGNWVVGLTPAPGLRLDGELVHVGDRLDVGGVRLGSYTLFNLRAAVDWRQHWQVEVRIENLADRDYQPLDGFNAFDRSFWIRLGYRG